MFQDFLIHWLRFGRAATRDNRMRELIRTIVLLHLLFAVNAYVVAEEVGGDWVDVLKTVETGSNVVAGRWQKTERGLVSSAVDGSRIVLPVQPDGEYDFRVRFTRTTGSNSVALIFVAGGRQVTFDIDGWSQHLAGIQQIDGRDMCSYRDRVANVTLQNSQAYTAVVQVRKDEVRAYLDDKLLHSHRTDGSDLALLDLWKLPDTKSLGLGAWNSATTFHSIEVRSLSGKPATPTPQPRPASTGNSRDELASLSDDFDDRETLDRWQRVHETERTGADQLERYDIGQTQRGWMTLVPYASTWYRDYRGVLVHKRVTGDFVVTTHVRTAGRSGRGAPGRQFSLAGIMVRTPRRVTPQTWRPGAENYIFLSHGTANRPGNYQFEVKTTINSDSKLEISDTRHAEAEIRVARLGEHFVLLRREPGGRWMVHRRYRRSDMPAELQVGMTVYTDYENASRLDAARHNRTAVRDGQPDLVASFDYFRFQRPQIPSNLQGRVLSDAAAVPDAELLRFLGESLAAPEPGEPAPNRTNTSTAPARPSPRHQPRRPRRFRAPILRHRQPLRQSPHRPSGSRMRTAMRRRFNRSCGSIV